MRKIRHKKLKSIASSSLWLFLNFSQFSGVASKVVID
jgi:hypothetical protein